jgi:4-hydroxybutyrate dehydrogenase/sulfolactaldehyde 3-reductase
VKNIGFIGVGVMGTPMVRNLIKAGFRVSVFDINPVAVAAVVANGAIAAATPAAVAADADCVITMVPDSPHVEAVLFGEDGVVTTIRPGTLYIDMSTISPAVTDSVAKRMAARHVDMLDAPVGRSSQHAEDATSLFMVGGDAAVLQRATPVLESLGSTIIHCGAAGAGIRMKIVNNFLASATNVATSQALALAEANGIDPELARSIMVGTVAGQGHLSTTYPAKVLKGDLTPGFMIELVIKDVGIAIGLANSVGMHLSMAETALATYAAATVAGHARDDWTAIYADARRRLNAKVPS